jgi:hypothetical protein
MLLFLSQVMIKHHATMALQLGATQYPIEGRMVPLKCQSGETQCFPILPDEKNIDLEVANCAAVLRSPRLRAD